MLKIGTLLTGLPSVVLVTLYMLEAQDVAHCTQAGGSWDFLKGLCDMENKHEFSTFMARHGIWVNLGMLVSIVGLGMMTWGMILRGMGTPKD